MNNPLMGGSQMGNMQAVMQRLNQFKQMLSGDPRQQIQQMLNSGTISQRRYNEAYQMAQQLQRMMSGK